MILYHNRGGVSCPCGLWLPREVHMEGDPQTIFWRVDIVHEYSRNSSVSVYQLALLWETAFGSSEFFMKTLSSFSFYLLIQLLLFFFHYHLVPLCSLPPAINTLLSMFMSPFSFLFECSTLNSLHPQLSSCSPFMSLSQFSLLVQFIH